MDEAAGLFTPDAVVIDDGGRNEGAEAIAGWVANSSTEFDYTVTRIGQVVDDTRPEVLVRLDGNFPGGTFTLRNRFVLVDGVIRALTIEP